MAWGHRWGVRIVVAGYGAEVGRTLGPQQDVEAMRLIPGRGRLRHVTTVLTGLEAVVEVTLLYLQRGTVLGES